MMKPILNAMRLQAQRNASERRETEPGIVTSYDPDNYAVRVDLQVAGISSGWLPLCSPWIGNGWGFFAAPSIGDMVEVSYFGGALEAGFVEGRLFNDEDRPLSVPSAEFWIVHKSGSFLKFTNDGDVLVNSARDLAAVVGRNLSANVAGDASLGVDGNATLDVTGDATATIGGALDVTAATASITAATTITGETTVDGALIVNGPTTLNGPLAQGSGGAGGTTAHLIGPLNVDTDVVADGISLAGHKHGGVQTGGGVSGGPQ